MSEAWVPNHSLRTGAFTFLARRATRIDPQHVDSAVRVGVYIIPTTGGGGGDVKPPKRLGIDGVFSDFPDTAFGAGRSPGL